PCHPQAMLPGSNGQTPSLQGDLCCPFCLEAVLRCRAAYASRGGDEHVCIPCRTNTPRTVGQREPPEVQSKGTTAFRPQTILAAAINHDVVRPLAGQLHPPTRTPDGGERPLGHDCLGRHHDLGRLEHDHQHHRGGGGDG